jgi:hypothetical protein
MLDKQNGVIATEELVGVDHGIVRDAPAGIATAKEDLYVLPGKERRADRTPLETKWFDVFHVTPPETA